MYKCKCNGEFDSSQSLNAHKGHCKVALGSRYENSLLSQKRRIIML